MFEYSDQVSFSERRKIFHHWNTKHILFNILMKITFPSVKASCVSVLEYTALSQGWSPTTQFLLPTVVMKNVETKTPMHCQCLQLLEHCSDSQTAKIKYLVTYNRPGQDMHTFKTYL